VPPIEVFVDSGAWIAIIIARDTHHAAATGLYRHLLQEGRDLVTTNLVVAEAYEAIRRFAGHSPAVRFLEILRQTSRLTRIYTTPALDEQAEAILRNYADQNFSYVDAVSFAVMRNRKIAEALVISESTAEVHVKRILSKLQFKSRSQVATWATQRALVPTQADPRG